MERDRPAQSGSTLPCFFLAEPPGERPARLWEGEAEHALRVLRLRPGDLCETIDGAGRRWRMKIVAASEHHIGLEPLGPPTREPAPGTPDAPLPWIELCVSWPRRARGEEMLGRLVQLGAAAVRPLAARQRGAGECPPGPSERWWRIAREAAKQCGRSWLPELGERTSPQALALERRGCAIALLEPRRGMSLDTWARSLLPLTGEMGSEERPIVLVVGPEGGFTGEEMEVLLCVGATQVRLGPHVLRVETAAEAALAVTATVLAR